MKDALKRAKNKSEYARIAAVNLVLNKNVSVDTVSDGFCVSRGTVYAWLAAYDRNGLDGLADDVEPGRPPFIPHNRLKKIIGDAKQFTAYRFVKLVKKVTGYHSGPTCLGTIAGAEATCSYHYSLQIAISLGLPVFRNHLSTGDGAVMSIYSF